MLISIALLLAGCGGSIEKNIIGGWKTVYDEEVESYIEFDEERMLIRESLDDDPISAEYILTEKADEGFVLEAIEPSNGEKEFLFEGYFEDKDTIEIENQRDKGQLLRVDNMEEEISEYREEVEKEEAKRKAEEEKEKEQSRKEDEERELAIQEQIEVKGYDENSAEEMYKYSCAACHGSELAGGSGPSLETVGDELSPNEIENIITEGLPGMPRELLSEEEAEQVANWLADQA